MPINKLFIATLGGVLLLFSFNALACTQTICGCWQTVTLNYKVNLVDQQGIAADYIDLFCDDESKPISQTNVTGTAQFTINNETSPDCGYKRCKTIRFSDSNQQYSEKTVTLGESNQKKIILIKRYELPQGKIYSNPNYKSPAFKAHELPFQIPEIIGESKSVPFYALILKTYPKCSIKDAQRIKAQALFPKQKVFYERNCPDDNYEDMISYTSVDYNYDFLAVYAGSTLSEAKKLSAKIKKMNHYPGHNIRKMQVLHSIP